MKLFFLHKPTMKSFGNMPTLRIKHHASPKTFIVLGPPRNGTSMTAGLLHIMGVSMGNLREPDPLNPNGYFEDKDFLALENDMFRAADPRSNGFCPPSLSALPRVDRKFDRSIENLIEQRVHSCTNNAWGWKNTATCFLADFFLPYLSNPHFVVVLRNPVDSAKSMVKYVRHRRKKHMYHALSFIEALALQSRYQESICDLLQRRIEIPRIVLSYDDVLRNTSETIRTLCLFLKITENAAQVEKCKEFITHHAIGVAPNPSSH